VLSTFSLPLGSLAGIYGDSLSDDGTASGAPLPYQMESPLIRAADAAALGSASVTARAGVGTAPAARTRFINRAINGSTISAVISQFNSSFPSNVYTHLIFAIGTNERTRSRAQTQADITTLSASIPSGIPALVIGPAAWGWLYPGPNVIAGANDTRLNETNTDLLTLFVASHANTLYVDLRTPLWTTQTPPGTTNGLTADGQDMTVDGIHWTPAGRAAAWAVISPFVTFT